MACTRIAFASLVVLTAITAGRAEWSYKTTQDGQYKLGRNGSDLSVEVRTMTVSFRVPPDWRLYEGTAEPMNSIFSAGSPVSHFSLDFNVDENSRKLSLAEQYRSYLDFIRAHADDKVQMRREAKFR